jgi:hypothetical protein
MGLDDRLAEEIRFHVEQQTEKNLRAGMSPEEARRQALIQFGGVQQTRERTRDEFRGAYLENLRATFATACARCGGIRVSQGWPCCRSRSASPPTP